MAPALLLAPQSQIMWALLKPMVGLDPKEANLFKQPIIQSRLEPLLGSHYAGAVQLLETADKIQQEGPLFYVVSKYTPVPELAEKAGFVWNSETNQMAVLMVSGGAPQVFAEKLNAEVAAQIPVWPQELSDYTDPAKLQQQALNKAKQQLTDKIPVPTEVAPLVNTVTGLKDIKGQTKALIGDKQQSLVDNALSPLTEAKRNAEQQIQQVKDQSTSAVLDPMNDAKQQAQQQIQQVKDQSTSAVLDQMNDAKQQAQQQIQQVKDQSTSAVLDPMNDAKQQAQQQIQQVKDQSTSAVLSPVMETKQQAQQQIQQVKDQSTSAVLDPLNDAKQQAQQQVAPAKTNINIPLTQTTSSVEIFTEDDLAAELATEQQSIQAEQSQRVNALQQQIVIAEQQLQQASTAEDRKKIELQLQQLKTTLDLLKATH
ncbi:hypothetical protein [Rheinheimera sp. F8]|uniref:PspA/IM30 family protein n=1 Tax=Rheinheimera sp. F8 TaxID=1763998 RepID=UPI001AD821BC|nr:hypothetical protein [Rheinheimera sp. F8]